MTRSRHLSAFFNNIGYIEWPDGKAEFTDLWGDVGLPESNGFTVGDVHIKAKNETDVMAAIRHIENIRKGEDFQTDGAVVKVCDLALQAGGSATPTSSHAGRLRLSMRPRKP